MEQNATGIGSTRLRVAHCVLDLSGRELLGATGERLELRRQALEVLLVLGGRAGRVVPKEDLMRAVWPNVIVGDDSLVQAIADIRRALGDRDHRWVRTVARRGYILVAQAQDAPGRADAAADPAVAMARSAATTGANAALASVQAATAVRGRRLPATGIAAALLIVALAAWLGLDGSTDRSRDETANGKRMPLPAHVRGASLVVLPLESEDGAAGHDWFANAITSDLTTDLGGLRNTTVIGRGTARFYKGRDPRDIARELEVRYVLRGSVRRHPDRSRLNLSLVDGESGAIRWAQTIDVPRAELAHAVDDVTGQIARALKVALWRAEGERTSRMSPEQVVADDLAMQGWGVFMSSVNPEAFREARRLFELALARDPASVRALGGVSLSSSFGAIMGWMPDRDEAARRAEETLARLEQIDAGGSVTMLSRASVANMRNDWPGLLAVADTLVQRYPNEPTSHHHRCSALLRLGRFEESIPSCERAIAISPRDSRTAIWHGLIGLDQFMLGRYALAAEYTRRTVTWNSRLKGYWPVLAASLALDGRREDGERALHEFLAIEPDFTSAQIARIWSGAHPRFTEGLERMTFALRELGLP